MPLAIALLLLLTVPAHGAPGDPPSRVDSSALSFDPPEGLEVSVAAGASTTGTFTMTNTGGSNLDYSFPHFGNGRTLGGPDDFGYSWIDSHEQHGPTFEALNIQSTGTEVTPLIPSPGCEYSAPDEGYQVVDLPFAFSFYGEDQTQVWISANGFLTFDPLVFQVQCSFSIQNIPSTSRPNYFLAPLWADLHGYSSGQIFVEHLADGRFVVQWTNWARFDQQGQGNTFQAILYPNGEVRFQYIELNGTFGNATRVGVENQSGTVGLQVAAGGDYMEEGLAVRITEAPTFVTAVDPASGSLAPGATVQVAVTVNASSLLEGVYQGALHVITDEPENGAYAYPIEMTVAGEAGCVVEPPSLAFPDTIEGNVVADSVTVSNHGTAVCSLVEATTSDSDFGVAFTGPIDLQPGEEHEFEVTFAPSSAGPVTGTLTFATAGDDVTVQLQGLGIARPVPQLDADGLTIFVPIESYATETVMLSNAASEGAANLDFEITLILGKPPAQLPIRENRERIVSPEEGLRGSSAAGRELLPQTAATRIGDHGDELVNDGSFEAGTPNPYWAEGSLAFGSPICSHSINCNPNVGSGPYSGEWWVWFGGHLEFEAAFVSQTVAIPEGLARLSFMLEMPVVPTLGTFRILMDDAVIFEATGDDAPSYPTYQEVVINMEIFADGIERTLRFEAQLEAGSFFLDDVSLTAWVPILSVEPRSGSVEPGDTIELIFAADTEDAEVGQYDFHALITTNDPQTPELILPVTVIAIPVDTGEGATPTATRLDQNHPNPFSRSTTIEFSLATPGSVNISVFDAAGRRVDTILERQLEAGNHSVTWDAAGLAAGVYFYRMQTDDSTQTLRALIVR